MTATAFDEITLRDYFAANAMSAILSNRHFWSEVSHDSEYDVKMTANSAYSYADAMLTARGVGIKEPNPTYSNPLEEITRQLFIGGPWHGKHRFDVNAQYIECPPGQYHRHAFGVEGKLFKTIYVWSELHAEEAVDLILSTVK